MQKTSAEFYLEKGIEKAALNALKLGLPTETIHKITGIEEKEIEQMRKNLEKEG